MRKVISLSTLLILCCSEILLALLPNILTVSRSEGISILKNSEETLVVSANNNGQIIVLDTVDNNLFSLTFDEIEAAFFEPDSSDNLIIITKTGMADIWNLSTRQLIKSMKISSGVSSAYIYGGELIVGRVDGTLEIWNYEHDYKASSLSPWVTHKGTITAICFCDSTQQLVTAGIDGYIKTWSYYKHTLIKSEYLGNEAFITSMAITNDCEILVGTSDGAIIKYDKNLVQRYRYQGHNDKVTDIEMLSKDIFISSSSDGLVKIWEKQTFLPLVSYQTGSKVSSFQIVGDTIYIASNKGFQKFIYDSQKPEINGNTIQSFEPSSRTVLSFSVSDDSYILGVRVNGEELSIANEFNISVEFAGKYTVDAVDISGKTTTREFQILKYMWIVKPFEQYKAGDKISISNEDLNYYYSGDKRILKSLLSNFEPDTSPPFLTANTVQHSELGHEKTLHLSASDNSGSFIITVSNLDNRKSFTFASSNMSSIPIRVNSTGKYKITATDDFGNSSSLTIDLKLVPRKMFVTNELSENFGQLASIIGENETEYLVDELSSWVSKNYFSSILVDYFILEDSVIISAKQSESEPLSLDGVSYTSGKLVEKIKTGDRGNSLLLNDPYSSYTIPYDPGSRSLKIAGIPKLSIGYIIKNSFLVEVPAELDDMLWIRLSSGSGNDTEVIYFLPGKILDGNVLQLSFEPVPRFKYPLYIEALLSNGDYILITAMVSNTTYIIAVLVSIFIFALLLILIFRIKAIRILILLISAVIVAAYFANWFGLLPSKLQLINTEGENFVDRPEGYSNSSTELIIRHQELSKRINLLPLQLESINMKIDEWCSYKVQTTSAKAYRLSVLEDLLSKRSTLITLTKRTLDELEKLYVKVKADEHLGSFDENQIDNSLKALDELLSAALPVSPNDYRW